MKRQIGLMIALTLTLLMTACGSNNSNQSQAKDKGPDTYSESSASNNDSYSYGDGEMQMSMVDEEQSSYDSSNPENNNPTERMIIHQANLYINVKDLAKTQLILEDKVKKYGGYVIESTVNRIEDKYLSGNMIIRVPEEHFHTFLTDTEEMAADVVERYITGQDVTEDYVDLTSRVKSKRVVEERLISFMKEAKETKDLLTISNDLAQIQEEIELIVGQMNYLENQASYSTIEISMSEEKVVVPEIDSSKLDTWEKTKKQLSNSVNVLLAAGSGLIIFFVGNIPIILLLALIGLIIFVIIRRQLQKRE